jgi:hypothetical protein
MHQLVILLTVQVESSEAEVLRAAIHRVLLEKTINDLVKMGRDTVKLACMGTDAIWSMKQAKLSKKFTTDINDILVVI